MLNGTDIDIAHYLAEPASVSELDREQLASLIGQLEHLKALAWARLISTPASAIEARTGNDRMLTVEEAAVLMRKKPQYLYRNKNRFSSFMKKTGPRSYVCSEAGVQRWLVNRKT
jgi:hypothetical protein